ncbi:BCCT family transporter [Nocardiopsis chromatogenes]|uniref:BCCT family transporter n=1 Tax=Nocardiopsis chromatogenes TaxID=280239 RepID=UPI0004782B76|nr:BCCT family transporter [Nocardiopsis chromatogenes]
MPGRGRVDVWVLSVSGGLLTAFVIAALTAPGATGDAVAAAFAWSAGAFGAYWQVLLVATVAVAAVLAFSRYGRVRMGGTAAPEFGAFRWVAMVLTTLLAAGGVFWAAAEPIAHYTEAPPQYADAVDGPMAAAATALAQSFTHWGLAAWAVGGSLATLVMMRGAEKGMPLRPRTLLHPLMGERIRTHWLGTAVDIACVAAVVAGTVGPLGFLGLQMSYMAGVLFGTPDSYAVQAGTILGLTGVALASLLSGISRGIQLLSRINVWVALALVAAIVALGSAAYVADVYLQASAVYAREFATMALFRGDTEWLAYWTVFFFGWFLGYAPMMAIFIARISRGRTVRQIFVGATVLPAVVTMVWFSALGGTGLYLEQQDPGAVSGPYAEHGLPAAAMSIIQALPFTLGLGVIMIVVSLLFFASTMDTMSYTIAASSVRGGEPLPWVRAFWCVGMGLAGAALLGVGDGGVDALQSFIVIAAVPVGFVLLPTLWTAPRLVREMAAEQGITGPPGTAADRPEDALPAEAVPAGGR